ncbi:hypothetical protein HGRIS_007937 [Hohenbuehelia grisea]|uniref:Uncharacterized protein n=1 Tax=Hohenbuehelia grisea TaxID=104357 RepID=A0ABR3J6D4_9AGAR
MQQQPGYPTFNPYFPNAPMYVPPTPHMGGPPGVPNGPYMPFCPGPQMQAGYPQAGAPTPAMNPAPLARPKKYSQYESQKKSMFPLKSAMKRQEAAVETLPYRKNSGNGQQPTGLGRSRTQSGPKSPTTPERPPFIPLHMFLSFHGDNEVRFENAVTQAIPELRRRIIPLWGPGVELDEQEGFTWRVRLVGSPWNSKDVDGMSAFNIITEIFTLFARRGYTYRTSMKTGVSAPRLIFEACGIDNSARFFLGYFSRSGLRVTLVTPPPDVDVAIGQRLKIALPGLIASDRFLNDSLRVIEFKQPAQQFSKHFFVTYVLKLLDDLGYNLEATIPLGTRIPVLGLGPRREVFVFRGALQSQT